MNKNELNDPVSTTPGDGTRSATSRWSVWLTVVLVVVWATEALVIQFWAFGSGFDELHIGWTCRHLLRLLFNLSFVLALLCVLPRTLFSVVMVFDFVLSVVLITYQGYFGHALSIVAAVSQFEEGLAVGGFAVEMVPWEGLLALLFCLVFKLLICWMNSPPPLDHLAGVPKSRLCAGSLCAWVLFGATMMVVDNPRDLCRQKSVGRVVMTYTYTGAWVVEAIYKDYDWMRDQLLSASRSGKSDRLSDQLPHFPIEGHVVFVQVESLDDAVLSHKVHGKFVTPFLRRLRQRSLYRPIRAIHNNGSCDADFTMLTGFAPPAGFMPYILDQFPIQDTIVAAFRRAGYRTIAIHGNTGDYFRRRNSFEQMGFDKLVFTEELIRDFQLDAPSNSVQLKDADVFKVSAKLLEGAKQPTMQFLITMTSHGPFQSLIKGEMKLFPEPSGLAENYLNSIHYVDREIERFYSRLPTGTVLIIYGDHCSRAGYSEARQEPGREIVPFFIAKKGHAENLVASSYPDGAEGPGEVSFVDASNYLRRCLLAKGESQTRNSLTTSRHQTGHRDTNHRMAVLRRPE